MHATHPESGTALHHCDTDALNAVLRGELSAVETYDQALAKFAGHPAADELRPMREDHQRAVDTLRHQVRQFGGEPATGSGAWGTFATAVQGVAKVIGPKASLAALKQGEEQGVIDYQAVLDNPGVAAECKFLVRSELLPRTHQHIDALDRMIAGLGEK